MRRPSGVLREKSMRLRFNTSLTLRIAAFVLATLSATSALVAAGLNDESTAPAAPIASK